MRNFGYICGAFAKSNSTLPGTGIFISASGKHRNGLSVPDGFCTVRSEIVFGETGDKAALFMCLYHSFSFMPKTMSNCDLGNNSTRKAAPRRAKSASVVTVELPIISNPYSIPTFLDFIAEAVRRFEIEKNAKNEAYAFILSSGHLDDYIEFSRTYKGEGDTIEGRVELAINTI